MLPPVFSRWAPLLLSVAHVFAVTPTITAVGSKFFTSDGDQFYIKGANPFPPTADPPGLLTLLHVVRHRLPIGLD